MSTPNGTAVRDRTDLELARLAAIVDSSDDAILSQDLEGVIQTWNRAAERIFGYSEEEAVGRHVSLLSPEELWQQEEELLQRIVTGEPIAHYRTIRRRKDGGEVYVSLTLSPVQSTDGQVVAASIIARDITDRLRIEELLARQTEELQRSNSDLERFAYVASHDLQEPLRIVTSFVQLLERRYRGKLDTQADELIAYIVNGAERMKRLIQDLLTYARVGRRGSLDELVNLQAVLGDVLGGLEMVLRDSGATVIRGPLPTVLGNSTEIQQLLHNLIANALKFRREVAPEIRIGAERTGREWIVSVCDNGIGIEPQFFDRIFVVFQRLHGMDEYPGTGIGLALCKRIVERHGGRIWVESKPGEGSVFRFTLPMEVQDAPLYSRTLRRGSAG